MDAKNVYQPIDVNTFPEKEIIAFIEAEYENLRQSIESNIRAHRMNSTGKTIRSMQILKEEGTNKSEISLIGRENFGNLETGTPPGAQEPGFERDILEWIMAKFPIQTEQAGLSFAVYVSRMIKSEGSLMYRSGDRADIFSTARADSFIKINDYIDGRIQMFLETITL